MSLYQFSLSRLACALAIALAVDAANAMAADVVIQPKAGSGFIVTDASGTQTRLRVNESGEIIIPILVNGVQKNLPLCFSTDGRIGPCAPGAGGSVGPQGPAGPAGPVGPTGPAGIGGTYTAGTGLALGGSTFSVAPTYQLPQTCAANQVAQWNGATWICADAFAGFTLPYTATTSSPTWAFSVTDTANGDGVVGVGTGGVGVRGSSDTSAGVSGTSNKGIGVYALSANNIAMLGTTISGAAAVAGNANNSSIGVLGQGSAGPGVKGVSTTGYAMVAEGSTQQNLNQGGWVKAMLHADTNGNIADCWNSQLPANSASNPPCGFTLAPIPPQNGDLRVDFHFPTQHRFYSATTSNGTYTNTVVRVIIPTGGIPSECPDVGTNTQTTVCVKTDEGSIVGSFYLLVF